MIEARENDGGASATAMAGASAILARAVDAGPSAAARLADAIDDLFRDDDARLDDRTRLTLTAMLSDAVAGVGTGLVAHAARLLATRTGASGAVSMPGAVAVLDRLGATELLRDADLMRELIGRARQDVLADALPLEASDQVERASLLPRLTQAADPVVANGARALLAAESRRRGPAALGSARPADLPAELHRRLVWWVAAAARDCAGNEPQPALDQALIDAGQRAIAAHDETDALEAAAMRLAEAIDAAADELPALLIEALADRRLSLFVALLGHAIGLGYADARDIVLDPAADRLWLALRALELDRATIARIGLSLCDADPRRDVERFADTLDAIVAIAPDAARRAFAPLLLHPDYRAALAALARGQGRAR